MDKFPSGTVTFLFTDIEDSTRLWQDQPEAMTAAHARHDAILHEAVASNHGYIFHIVGDAFNAAFHNAIDALAAALAAQRGLEIAQKDAPLKIRVRMGLHTGAAEILAGGEYKGYITLASTQRVMSAANGGQVLLSRTTADLLGALPDEVSLRDMGEHQLKSLRAPLLLYQLIAPDLPQDFPPLHSLQASPNNLPVQLTSFIGREKQIEEAGQLLGNTRMLTFIGPGGTGKTRLSLQLAEIQLSKFKDGAWFVELAALQDAAYVIPTVLSTFGLHEVEGVPVTAPLLDYLRGKHLILLLDNCEHLVETCAQLAARLLQDCPGIKIIVSSREALGINGETVYRVSSLETEEAAQLFIERAMKADPHFQASDVNMPLIEQICSRLDGIPLAIELAAARVRLFSPQQIAEHLDDRFKLLTGGSRTALPRQQTLRALIDWSYQTLNETEKRALRCLAVFSGGWTYEAAEAVIGESEAFDALSGLVNKSLVNVEDREGESRYFFLETIRQYAMEKLVEAGEANEIRSRHLDYISGFVGQAESLPYGSDLEQANRIDSERDNLRAALEWAVARNIEEAMHLVLKVGLYWSTRDLISEAGSWYRTILLKSESVSGHDAERAAIYSLLGWISILLGQHREGRAAAEAAISLAESSGAVRTIVLSLCTLALSCVFLGDLQAAESATIKAEALAREKGFREELGMALSTRAQMIYFATRDAMSAKAFLEEAMLLSPKSSYRWGISFQSFGQARLAASLGDLETARVKFAEAADMARRVGNKRIVFSSRSELAHVLREHGRIDEALEIYQDIIPGWREIGHRAALAHELECIGYILSRKEEPEKAIRLISAAQSLRRAIDTPRTGPEEAEYEKELGSLKSMQAEDEFRAQWAMGEALDLDDAISLALAA